MRGQLAQAALRAAIGCGRRLTGRSPPSRPAPPMSHSPWKNAPSSITRRGETRVAFTLRARQQLDALAALDAAADRAADGDHAAVDLGVHLARLPDDQRVLGDDAALELAVDAEGVAEAQLAVELGSRRP